MCKKVLLSAFLFSCCLQANCSGINEFALEPDEEAVTAFSIRTTQTEYVVTANQSLTVNYELSNEGKNVIYYPNHGNGHVHGWYLEKRRDGEWGLAYSQIVPDILLPPNRIKPGETIPVIMNIEPETWDPALRPPQRVVEPAWRGGDIAGTYRIAVEVFTDWTQKKHESGTATIEIVFSNPFEVRRGQ
jgi:hypothetical protein